jgi:hypothetical protein
VREAAERNGEEVDRGDGEMGAVSVWAVCVRAAAERNGEEVDRGDGEMGGGGCSAAEVVCLHGQTGRHGRRASCGCLELCRQGGA